MASRALAGAPDASLQTMTSDHQNLGYRLEELERRWTQAPDRTILLQLAEEYGRHERWRDAVRVLEEGLTRNPDHLAARVALGRSHLRSGYPADACTALETVIEADPMHLVANKLLVEAYLDTGQVPRARDRLDLYSLLAGSDPDVERLESEVAAGERGEPRAPVVRQPEPPAQPGRTAPVSVETTGLPGAAPGGFARPPAYVTSQPRPLLATSSPVAQAGEAMFPVAGDLGDGFDLLQLAPLGVVESPARRLFGGTVEDPFAELLSRAPQAAAESSPAGELFALHATGVSVLVAPAVGGTSAAVESTAREGSLSASGVAEPAVVLESETDSAEADGAPATVTLGRLYLAQGHPERAAGVFARVLAERPQDEEARAGLAEARAASGWSLTADHLLRDREPQSGSAARRRALLDNYLERLRSSSGRAGGAPIV